MKEAQKVYSAKLSFDFRCFSSVLWSSLGIGHQWLKSHVGVLAQSAWSVDTFGHGPMAPYLLHASGLHNSVVQRVHYAWKRWFADRQISDFHWQMPFDQDGGAMLTHNMPFDIYSTKHSCGPDPQTCLVYDFRSVRGEYDEATLNAVPISKYNVKEKVSTSSFTATNLNHVNALLVYEKYLRKKLL